MLEHIHSNLHAVCAGVKANKVSLPSAFWHCWSFVDTAHRIREIAQALPGLSNKTPELRAFLDATIIAEEFRHYIQHLRRELSKIPGNSYPVWGSLSWVDPADPLLMHTILAGAQVGNTQYAGCVYDTFEHKWVSKVSLSIDGKSFNFDPIFDVCLQFRDFVVPWLLATYAPGIKFREELPILSARLQHIMHDDT
ncbi:MAG: hypothetical protein Q8L97_01525 [Nitrosomonas sp.]|uniref:hypothetical protein n=1 Tax=Nitrosomonas sp. TaxID=42353 RepID=UPI002731DF96|nr:hypothetical protein [Nitrosomonas sp.]MDP1548828.1 hypothetical protein [Nitrosomonas sp.]